MTRSDVADLLASLSERDLAVLGSLRAHRLLSTAFVRRLHFAHGSGGRHTSQGAAAGAAMRVLSRLEEHKLVVRLRRRIGGVRAGSSGIVWQLGATGERLLRTLHGESKRRRYLEPSQAFVAHTLATAELAVRLRELGRVSLELITLEPEPECWRSFLAPHGGQTWLKPDLFAITASGDYESHWFIETDLATEHPGAVVRKAETYQRYAATGAHQTKHGLFPVVLWVVPDEARRRMLTSALSRTRALQAALFRVITAAAFGDHIAGDGPEPATADDAQRKGGTTYGTAEL